MGPMSEKLLGPLVNLGGDMPLKELKRFKFMYGELFDKKIVHLATIGITQWRVLYIS
ncbi:unnamed protein product, partial [marine sediment metagenome]